VARLNALKCCSHSPDGVRITAGDKLLIDGSQWRTQDFSTGGSWCQKGRSEARRAEAGGMKGREHKVEFLRRREASPPHKLRVVGERSPWFRAEPQPVKVFVHYSRWLFVALQLLSYNVSGVLLRPRIGK